MRGICAATAALALCGCSPLSALTGAPGRTTNADVLKALSEHMDGCDRHYQGGLGVGASFTFTVDCKAQPVDGRGGRGAVSADPGESS